MPRNPIDDLEELFERMESQFESGVGFGTRSVPVNVRDADGEYQVTADLPGFTGEDIELTFTEGRLHISGEREHTELEEDERFLRQERRANAINRTVQLPERVIQDEIRASFDNGVLTVTLPKEHGGEEGKEIEIE
jgi:HSP20 family protein